MLDWKESIASKSSLIISMAIEQRKRARLDKWDLIKRLQVHDYSDCIAHTRAEIAVLQRRLERELRQQADLPATLLRHQAEREQWTEEIAKLQAVVPKDVAGKIARRLAEMGLTYEQIVEGIRQSEKPH